MRIPAFAALAALLVCGPALADATNPTKDIAKSKDHPQVQRYDGSFIVDYDYRAFTDQMFPLSKLEATGKSDSNNNAERLPKQKQDVEGARTRIVYVIPEGRSPLEVLRNYQQDLAKKGGKTLYECKGEECGGNAMYGADTGGGTQGLIQHTYPYKEYRGQNFTNGSCALTSNLSDQRYATMKFTAGGIDSFAGIHVFTTGGGTYCKALEGRTVVVLNIVDMKAREQKMVTVSSDDMTKGMNANGRIALYGILFDFDKADVKPESKPQLDQIAKLLKANPKLKVLIVGHTDNSGALDYNRNLSTRRAQAIVAALAKQYAVPAGQMIAVGVGPAAPTATNDNEDGKAKNRRVELVKM